MISKLYRKASANMAFVRTGMGGAKPIKDGGTLVIPVVHQVIPVSLETMRLNVERRGPHALITKDNLRVDLSAEFYIKVQANTDDIIQAARSLGGRNVQPDMVSELVQEKLVSALRTVAATKELVELHAKRLFVELGFQHARPVAQRGSRTRDYRPRQKTLRPAENVFDAQGLRRSQNRRSRVEHNQIEMEAQRGGQERRDQEKVLDMGTTRPSSKPTSSQGRQRPAAHERRWQVQALQDKPSPARHQQKQIGAAEVEHAGVEQALGGAEDRRSPEPRAETSEIS